MEWIVRRSRGGASRSPRRLAPSPPAHRRNVRLKLELLEDRTLPAISISTLTNPSVFGQAVTYTGTTATAGDHVNIEDITSGTTLLGSGVATSSSAYSITVS